MTQTTHHLPPFAVRALRDYETPAWDVVYCDPRTWQCFYLDDSFLGTEAEAIELAEKLNAAGTPAGWEMTSMEGSK